MTKKARIQRSARASGWQGRWRVTDLPFRRALGPVLMARVPRAQLWALLEQRNVLVPLRRHRTALKGWLAVPCSHEEAQDAVVVAHAHWLTHLRPQLEQHWDLPELMRVIDSQSALWLGMDTPELLAALLALQRQPDIDTAALALACGTR